VLKSAIQHAKLGQEERLGALKWLDNQARRLERLAAGSSVPALIALGSVEIQRELMMAAAR
jgi:hypothetical protein